MSKNKTQRTKAPSSGFELIEPTLNELEQK